jgi:hypothetical protein
MCNGTWAEIDPLKTPSVCAFKWRKSLLNLPLHQDPELSALRYPDREDRMQARQRWLNAIKTGKIKGGQLCPAAMVAALESAKSQEEIDLIDVQWVSLRETILAKCEQADDRNVQMIAGYSPSLFDLILCGMPEPTPYQTMRRKLDSSRYQPVRDTFDKHEL